MSSEADSRFTIRRAHMSDPTSTTLCWLYLRAPLQGREANRIAPPASLGSRSHYEKNLDQLFLPISQKNEDGPRPQRSLSRKGSFARECFRVEI